jgi:hypothetical protein
MKPLELPVDWNDPIPRRTANAPYHVQRTPRGSVVICARHIVTDEVKDEEALAIATALNEEFQQRMKP